MAKDMCKCCAHKGHGVKMLILGLLIVANVKWAFLDWGYFIGILVALGGLCKLLMK